MPGYDIVLGCDLLSQHSPVAFDYDKRTIILMKGGKQQITIPACNSIANATEIGSAEFHAMLANGASGYAIHLIRDVTMKSPVEHVTPPQVEQLL